MFLCYRGKRNGEQPLNTLNFCVSGCQVALRCQHISPLRISPHYQTFNTLPHSHIGKFPITCNFFIKNVAANKCQHQKKC